MPWVWHRCCAAARRVVSRRRYGSCWNCCKMRPGFRYQEKWKSNWKGREVQTITSIIWCDSIVIDVWLKHGVKRDVEYCSIMQLWIIESLSTFAVVSRNIDVSMKRKSLALHVNVEVARFLNHGSCAVRDLSVSNNFQLHAMVSRNGGYGKRSAGGVRRAGWK